MRVSLRQDLHFLLLAALLQLTAREIPRRWLTQQNESFHMYMVSHSLDGDFF